MEKSTNCVTLFEFTDRDNPNYYSPDGCLVEKGTDKLVRGRTDRYGNAIVPDCVKSIGDEAFYGCLSLENCHTMFGEKHRGMFFRELCFPKERDGTAFCEEHRKRNVSGLRFSENRHRSEIAREYQKGCVRSERCGEEGVTKLYCKIHIDFIFDEFLYQ